jgi:glycosyltransferase involved in cell wall biosynthesis
LISVALASYNGAKFIAAQLQSILCQLGTNDEIVVSDDASSDDTVSVVQSLSDARVRVLAHGQRVGYIKNFERCIRAVRGTYVFLSDQDDVWSPDKVSTAVDMLKIAPCVASDAVVVDENLQVLFPSYFQQRKVDSTSALSLLLRPSIIGATMACRREFLMSYLPFPRGVPHDFWLVMNAALRGELAIINRPLILYRRHASALSPTALDRKRPLSRILAERARLIAALASHGLMRRS